MLEQAGLGLAAAGRQRRHLRATATTARPDWTIDVERVHCYHLIPKPASKARGVARHMQIRGYLPEECIACGDSREDMEAADVVGTFWLMANALEQDPTLSADIAGRSNVRVSTAGHGAGVYEAVVTTLAESRGSAAGHLGSSIPGRARARRARRSAAEPGAWLRALRTERRLGVADHGLPRRRPAGRPAAGGWLAPCEFTETGERSRRKFGRRGVARGGSTSASLCTGSSSAPASAISGSVPRMPSRLTDWAGEQPTDRLPQRRRPARDRRRGHRGGGDPRPRAARLRRGATAEQRSW